LFKLLRTSGGAALVWLLTVQPAAMGTMMEHEKVLSAFPDQQYRRNTGGPTQGTTSSLFRPHANMSLPADTHNVGGLEYSPATSMLYAFAWLGSYVPETRPQNGTNETHSAGRWSGDEHFLAIEPSTGHATSLGVIPEIHWVRPGVSCMVGTEYYSLMATASHDERLVHMSFATTPTPTPTSPPTGPLPTSPPTSTSRHAQGKCTFEDNSQICPEFRGGFGWNCQRTYPSGTKIKHKCLSEKEAKQILVRIV